MNTLLRFNIEKKIEEKKACFQFFDLYNFFLSYQLQQEGRTHGLLCNFFHSCYVCDKKKTALNSQSSWTSLLARYYRFFCCNEVPHLHSKITSAIENASMPNSSTWGTGSTLLGVAKPRVPENANEMQGRFANTHSWSLFGNITLLLFFELWPRFYDIFI